MTITYNDQLNNDFININNTYNNNRESNNINWGSNNINYVSTLSNYNNNNNRRSTGISITDNNINRGSTNEQLNMVISELTIHIIKEIKNGIYPNVLINYIKGRIINIITNSNITPDTPEQNHCSVGRPVIDNNNCSICLEEEKCMAFINCGHMCICENCSDKIIISKCPICRTSGRAIKIFR